MLPPLLYHKTRSERMISNYCLLLGFKYKPSIWIQAYKLGLSPLNEKLDNFRFRGTSPKFPGHSEDAEWPYLTWKLRRDALKPEIVHISVE